MKLLQLVTLYIFEKVCHAAPVRPPRYIFANRTVIEVCSSSVIRVSRVPIPNNFTAVDNRVSLIARRDWEPTDVEVSSSRGYTIIRTSAMYVQIDEATGNVEFKDLNDTTILKENFTKFSPTTDLNHSTYSIEQTWQLLDSESIYGGGEFQNGFLDYTNVPIQLVQFNDEAIVPFFVSTKGYGILWDNYAWSYLNANQMYEIGTTKLVSASAVQQGSPIMGNDCSDGDTFYSRQFWRFDEEVSKFYILNTTSSLNLVMDWDHDKKKLHLWEESVQFNSNQQWFLNGTFLQSKNEPILCLQASSASSVGSFSLTAQPCNVSVDLQHWKYNSQKQLQLLQDTSMCLTARDLVPIHTFVASMTG